MPVDHIMVGGLTAVSIALLVWVEIRSRRNSAKQEEKRSAPRTEEGPPLDRPRSGNAA
jgi:predicted Holliday junction resolvase-like endonuclease